MTRTRTTFMTLMCCLALGCGKDEPAKARAPLASASALEPAKPSAPGAIRLKVDGASSGFTFLMDSALEKIEGDAPASLQGELFVVPTDLRRSSALVRADLQLLTLYQQKRGDEQAAYGERKKSDLQNEHARDWLQLREKEGEVTAQQAAQNRYAELKIVELSELSASDVTQLTGSSRKVTALASGDFLLHGRKARKSTKVELTFEYEGDQLRAVQVKTLEPLPVSLEEFDVHPRDAAGKLVKRLSDALASNLKGKVASEAPVAVRFVAKPE